MPDETDVGARALSIRCPRCGSESGVSCKSYYGRFKEGRHPERLAAAQGLPAKENRHNLGQLQFQQRRVDQVLEVRFIEDDEAA